MEESRVSCLPAAFLEWKPLPAKSSEALRRAACALLFRSHSIRSGCRWRSARIQHLLSSSPVIGAGEELFKMLSIRVVLSSHSFLFEKLWEGAWYHWWNTVIIFSSTFFHCCTFSRSEELHKQRKDPMECMPFLPFCHQHQDLSWQFHFPCSSDHTFYSGRMKCQKNRRVSEEFILSHYCCKKTVHKPRTLRKRLLSNTNKAGVLYESLPIHWSFPGDAFLQLAY